MNIPGKLTSKSCSLHDRDCLTGFFLDVHIKKGRDNKKHRPAQKERPKQTTSITKISGFHRLQFLRSEDFIRFQDLFVYLIGTRAGGLGVS